MSAVELKHLPQAKHLLHLVHLARVTSVKSSIGIITHKGHISQVSANDYSVSEGRLSLLERLVTLKSTALVEIC